MSRYNHKRLINPLLLLLQADNLAGKLSVERNLYSLLHEKLAGKGMTLPMVGPAIATDFSKFIRCIRVETSKMKTRTELVNIMLKLISKEYGIGLVIRDVKFRGIARLVVG